MRNGRTYLYEGKWITPKDVCKMLGITKGVFYHQMKLYDRDVTRIIKRYKNDKRKKQIKEGKLGK